MRRVFPNLTNANNLLSGLLALGLAPLFTIAIFMLFLNVLVYEYHPNRKFEMESWQENAQDRHEMSEDLLESKLLINKTKAQIATELGLPNDDILLESDTLSIWTYDMGVRGWGLGWKFYYLNIDFDNNLSKSVKIKEVID